LPAELPVQHGMAKLVGTDDPFHLIGKIVVDEDEGNIQHKGECTFLTGKIIPEHDFDAFFTADPERITGAVSADQL
jgi:hypothetical protein